MKAYHFLRDDMTAGSGNEPAWKIGETRTIEGELKMCGHGYHSSPSWFDCLSYAYGSMACMVDIPKRGTVKNGDKSVSRSRTLVDARNAEKTLRYWACDCAERALKVAKVTDDRSWNAIRVTRLYNEGKATKQELTAAAESARSAAESAWLARLAAWSAAMSAVESARSAWLAGDAASAAAGDAEEKWQRRRLNWYMKKLFNGEYGGVNDDSNPVS